MVFAFGGGQHAFVLNTRAYEQIDEAVRHIDDVLQGDNYNRKQLWIIEPRAGRDFDYRVKQMIIEKP